MCVEEVNTKPENTENKGDRGEKDEPAPRNWTYSEATKKNTEEIINKIENEGLGPIWSDRRCDLLLHLHTNNRLELSRGEIEDLKRYSVRRFSIVKLCFEKWEYFDSSNLSLIHI